LESAFVHPARIGAKYTFEREGGGREGGREGGRVKRLVLWLLFHFRLKTWIINTTDFLKRPVTLESGTFLRLFFYHTFLSLTEKWVIFFYHTLLFGSHLEIFLNDMFLLKKGLFIKPSKSN
jgi:hypothetical protein